MMGCELEPHLKTPIVCMHIYKHIWVYIHLQTYACMMDGC